MLTRSRDQFVFLCGKGSIWHASQQDYNHIFFFVFLPSATVVFCGCLSVHTWLYLPRQTPPRQTSPTLGRHPPGQTPLQDGHCSGRYASTGMYSCDMGVYLRAVIHISEFYNVCIFARYNTYLGILQHYNFFCLSFTVVISFTWFSED